MRPLFVLIPEVWTVLGLRVLRWQKSAVWHRSCPWQRKFLLSSDAPEPSWAPHPRPSVTSLLLHQISADMLLCHHSACFKRLLVNEASQIHLVLQKEKQSRWWGLRGSPVSEYQKERSRTCWTVRRCVDPPPAAVTVTLTASSAPALGRFLHFPQPGLPWTLCPGF